MNFQSFWYRSGFVPQPSNVSGRQLVNHQVSPIDIVFRNLVYTVTVKDDKSTVCNRLPKVHKEILKGTTGIIKHGRVTAIMGASGAGKTSLLNILACRIDKKRNVKISGDVLVNGRPYNYKLFGDFANYVMQNDILMQTLTVRETLEFAASMTLNVLEQQRNTIIDKLLNDLKLDKCANVLVGGYELKGISGGEKKRTSIAFELISDPQVIFLDEPTSGLDSLTAYVIVWYMKKLAATKNKTVAMTIHQPSSEIFSLFDDLILIVEGRLVYQGLASESVEYFSQMGLRCPEFSNPPDYFMSIMHHESKKNVSNYPKYYQTYNYSLVPKVTQVIQASEVGMWQKRPTSTNFCRVLSTLMWRDFLNIKRNPKLFVARIFQATVIGLVGGAVFWKLSDDYSDPSLSSKSFASKNGALFYFSVAQFFAAFSASLLTFPTEKPVFLKEQSNKMYSVFAYFLSRNIMELLMTYIGPTLYTLIVYWMMNLRSGASHFFMCLLITLMVSFAGNSYGLMISSFFNSQKVVAGMVPTVALTFIAFSGYFKNRKDIPGWLVWINYLSPIKYSFIAYAKNEYSNTSAPIESLGFELSLAQSLVLLLVISLSARIIAFIVLSLSKAKLQ